MKRSTAQWSSSLGRWWQNCSKKIRRLFNGYVTTYGKKIKGHVCLYTYFSLFGLETHFITKSPYFWAFLGLLKLIEGVVHGLKMLLNTFLLKIHPKAFKKLKFTSICSDDHGGFVTPFDHCAMVFYFFLASLNTQY